MSAAGERADALRGNAGRVNLGVHVQPSRANPEFVGVTTSINSRRTAHPMPDPLDNDASETRKRLTNREVVQAATTTGIIGFGLFTVGLAGVVLLGLLGTMSGEGNPAAAIGVGCVLLMLPSAVILGLGVACLNCSAAYAYSLLVGKPRSTARFNRRAPPHQKPNRARHRTGD